MKQKLLELDKALKSLVLPKLPNGTQLKAKCNTEYVSSKPTITIYDDKYLTANIVIERRDWYIEGLRHNIPAIIEATQLIDIVLEKIFGCCSYEMNSLVGYEVIKE